MSGGLFLVSLTEVSTSEKKKPGMPIPAQSGRQYYWIQEETEHTGEGDYEDAFLQKLELEE